MKKGINIWSFKVDTPVIDCIGIAKDAGFDGIELGFNETGAVKKNY